MHDRKNERLWVPSYQNELFRVETPGATGNPVGNRVVSGLAIDDAELQHQSHGPTASHRPVPGIAPLCEAYNNPAMSLGGIYLVNPCFCLVTEQAKPDWEKPGSWRNVLELGIIRLTPAAIEPCKL